MALESNNQLEITWLSERNEACIVDEDILEHGAPRALPMRIS